MYAVNSRNFKPFWKFSKIGSDFILFFICPQGFRNL